MSIDPLLAARVRIAALQARILEKSYDESRHPRDSHGRWSVGDKVLFTPHGSQPGTPPTIGTIVGSNSRDMTMAVEDHNGITHHVPTENLFDPSNGDEEADYGDGQAYGGSAIGRRQARKNTRARFGLK